MPNVKSNQNEKSRKFDLAERTLRFSKETIRFLKTLQPSALNTPILTQLVRSATSVGANYSEADGAESKKDFQHKISICKKECKETKYWIEILSTLYPEEKERLRILWKEAHELTLIFSKILNNSKSKILSI